MEADEDFMSVVAGAGLMHTLVGDRQTSDWLYDFVLGRLQDLMCRATVPQLDVCRQNCVCLRANKST